MDLNQAVAKATVALHGHPPMKCTPIQGLSSLKLAIVGLVSVVTMVSPFVHAQNGSPTVARRPENNADQQPEQPRGQWRAFGRVTDQSSRPLAGVEVSANCRYQDRLRRFRRGDQRRRWAIQLNFGPGLFSADGGTATQAATITAHKPGYFEENLHRQGDCLAANRPPSEEVIQILGNSTRPRLLAGPADGTQLRNAAGGPGCRDFDR